MLKKYVLNELHETPIKHEKSGVCRERSTIGKTTLADWFQKTPVVGVWRHF